MGQGVKKCDVSRRTWRGSHVAFLDVVGRRANLIGLFASAEAVLERSQSGQGLLGLRSDSLAHSLNPSVVYE